MLRLNWVFIYDHISSLSFVGLAGEAVERGGSSVPETERVGICCGQAGEAEAAWAASSDPGILIWGQVLRSKLPWPCDNNAFVTFYHSLSE